MSEQELVENETAELEAALSDDPPAPEPVQAEPEKATQERDENGRFKAKEKAEEPAQAPEGLPDGANPPVEKPADMVPVWRLNEVSQSRRETLSQLEQERQARAALERQLQEMQKAKQPQQPAQAPDMYQDPDAWRDWVIQQAEARAQNQAEQLVNRKMIERDLMRAKETHGELFDKAYAALEAEIMRGDRSNQLRILNAFSPGEELVKWFKQTEFLKEVQDPEAWRKQQEEAIRAKVLAELGQGSSDRPKVKMPPSLTKATAASSGDNDSIAFASDKEQHAAIFS